jgi:hypothetical protein
VARLKQTTLTPFEAATHDVVVTEVKVNVPDLVSNFIASLSDMILEQPTKEQPRLFEHAHRKLDQFIRGRRTN